MIITVYADGLATNLATIWYTDEHNIINVFFKVSLSIDIIKYNFPIKSHYSEWQMLS